MPKFKLRYKNNCYLELITELLLEPIERLYLLPASSVGTKAFW